MHFFSLLLLQSRVHVLLSSETKAGTALINTITLLVTPRIHTLANIVDNMERRVDQPRSEAPM
tara:strand:- start:1725 stop:1913 length:189 start_codon:yes stop_codon:yes gene_type:complete